MSDKRDYIAYKPVRGKIYVYFRTPDDRYFRLPDDENSIEFETAYQRCLRELRAGVVIDKPLPAVRAQPDSINCAVDVFIASWRYRSKEPRTRRQYRFVLEQIRAELGPAKLADLTSDTLDLHCENVAFERGPSVADRHANLLSLIWQVCKKHPQFMLTGFNPAIQFEKRYTKAIKPHRAWSEDAEERFMQTAPAYLQLAAIVLHYLGSRGGDTVLLEWDQYDGQGFTFAPEKTDDGSEPDYFLCPEPLRRALALTPRYDGVKTVLVNKFRRSWANAECLSHAIRAHLIKIGLATPGVRTISMHGLRKSMARDAAFAGVPEDGIQSLGGWKTGKMAAYYVGQAAKQRKNAAAVERLNAYDAERKAARVKAKRAVFKLVD